jgi:hypothetical protein
VIPYKSDPNMTSHGDRYPILNIFFESLIESVLVRLLFLNYGKVYFEPEVDELLIMLSSKVVQVY